MGTADRNYHQNDTPRGGGFFSQLTPVVKWLLIANITIYLLDTLPKGESVNGPLRAFGTFTIRSAVYEFRIWEFFTFQFLHGSLGHVLFNSVGLFFFGPWLERWWGPRKFIIFYLLCGVGGAAFFTLLVMSGVLADGFYSGLVGASAGIYGILIGVAVIAPNLRVALLFPPIELSMRQLAIALMVISVGVIVLKIGGNEGGEAGHLGGALLGFVLMRYPRLLGTVAGPNIIRPGAFSRRPPAKLRPRTDIEDHEDSTVDVILDKISREGVQSLTQKEREFLERTSNRNKQ